MSWFKLSLLGLLAAAAMYASQSEAKPNEFYLIGKGNEKSQGNKADAMKSLLTRESDTVFRCVEQEITEKLTFRNKKYGESRK